MKKVLIILLTVLAVTGIYSIENEYNLDLEKIKKMEHLNRYKDNDGYVKLLSAVELLEFAYELVLYDEKNFELDAMIIIVQLKDKLEDNKNKELILSLLRNDSYVPKFRAFLLDTANKFIKEDSRLYEEYQDTVLNIAKNNEADERLRKYAISKLDSERKKGLDEITKILESNNNKKLSSALLHKLRQAKHPDLESYVSPILNNPSEYDDEILQAAIMCLIPEFDIKYIQVIKKISEYSDNELIIASVLYKLSEMRHPESIIAYVDICNALISKSAKNKYVDYQNRFELKHSIKTIKLMIKHNEKEIYQIYGMEALMKAKLPISKEEIEKVILKSTSNKVKEMGNQVLKYLDENEVYLSSWKIRKNIIPEARGIK